MSLKSWTQIGTILLIMGMFAVVDMFAAREILFPEIAALALGFWIMETPPWRGTRFAAWASPTLAALTGVLLQRYVSAPPLMLIGAAFVLVVLQLKLFRSTVFPSISAAILAIITHTTSWLYPLSVGALMAIICLGRFSLEALALKEASEEPPDRLDHQDAGDSVIHEITYWGKLLAGALIITTVALRYHYLFMIAPPLIVAFVEWSRPDQSLRKKPVRTLLLLFLAAFSGVLWLHLVGSVFHGPLWIFSGLSLLSVFGLYRMLKVSFPPAAALALLPVLVPAADFWLYPLHVFMGGTLFFLMGICFFRGTETGRPAVSGWQKNI